jgi:hypothetical protein
MQAMVFPWQIPQHSMACFQAQPEGPVPFFRMVAFLVVHLEAPNFSPRALPCEKMASAHV